MNTRGIKRVCAPSLAQRFLYANVCQFYVILIIASFPTPVAAQTRQDAVNFTIYEMQPAGTFVGQIPTISNVQYRFLQSSAMFAVDAFTGQITTTTLLNINTLPSNPLTLYVVSVPSGKQVVTVTVTILDVNNNAPQFPHTSIQVYFSDADQPGTQVIIDTATDSDSGQNGKVVDYSIVSGNTGNLFTLYLFSDGTTTLLYLENTQKLNVALQSTYYLNISAKDGGEPALYGFELVQVTVQRATKNPPVFDHSQYSALISRSVLRGSVVLQVHATNGASGAAGVMSYSISSDDSGQFAVDNTTGIITTVKQPPLTCPQSCDQGNVNCQPPICTVTVIAADSTTPVPLTGRAFVSVTLRQDTSAPPLLSVTYYPNSPWFSSIDSDASIGTVVAVVSVTDNDNNLYRNVTLRIAAGNELGYFVVNQITVGLYTIKTTSQFRINANVMFNLTIAAESPVYTTVASVLVYVQKASLTKITFAQSAYNFAINDLSPSGSYVGIVHLADEIRQDISVTFSISSGDTFGWFNIDPSTGLIKTIAKVDRNQMALVGLQIRAGSSYSSISPATVNVTVTLLRSTTRAPQFNSSFYAVTLNETAGIGTLLTTVWAYLYRDSDITLPNNSVRYFFDDNAVINYPNLFFIDPVSGQLLLQSFVDYTVYSSFQFLIIARSVADLSLYSTAVVNVTVVRGSNNRPTFNPSMYFAKLYRSSSLKFRLLQVTAYDTDSGVNGYISYSLLPGTGSGLFDIDSSTGWIYTTNTFDTLTQKTFQLIVNVQDGRGLAATTAATVNILLVDYPDINSYPTFASSSYNFTVPIDASGRNSSIGIAVGKVQASSGTGVTMYYLTGGDANGLFAVDAITGMLTIVKGLRRELLDKFYLTITAVTGTYYFGQVKVSVTIYASNMQPKYISQSSAVAVNEKSPIGQLVYDVSSVDTNYAIDYATPFNYSISESQGPSIRYLVDSLGGISLIRRLLRDDVNKLSALTVSVPAVASAALNLIFALVDENDHTPALQARYIEIAVSEVQPPSSVFGRLVVRDDDAGRNGLITYTASSNCPVNIFPDGLLYVSGNLNYDFMSNCMLMIIAQDLGQQPRSSTITVMVYVNEAGTSSLVFTNSSYEMHVIEELKPGYTIGRVFATDSEKGRNGDIIYQVAPTYLVDIDADWGFITTAVKFDREQLVKTTGVDFIVLTVTATSCGMPPVQSSTNITLFIDDVNDNAPVFTPAQYYIKILENLPLGSSVLTVTASDADEGINGALRFDIFSGNVNNSFKINATTGKILIQSPLDRETVPTYDLIILVTDGGMPQLSATATVSIYLIDVNDNPPVFTSNTPRQVSVSEVNAPSSTVAVMLATDADLGLNAVVSYQIIAGNMRNSFDIGSRSGVITIAQSLSYRVANFYQLVVVASDSGMVPLQTNITINITVDFDFSTNPILFNLSTNIDVFEGTSIGTTVAKIQTDVNFPIGKVTYSIVTQEPANSLFSINALTGVILVSSSITSSSPRRCQLIVRATFPPVAPSLVGTYNQSLVSITIRIPSGTSLTFVSMNSFALSSIMPVGAELGKVQAKMGNAVGTQITYNLLSGNIQTFSINSLTGSLQLSSALSSSSLVYQLTVKATVSPGGNSATQQLNIFITSTSGPQFQISNYFGQIYENKPIGTVILPVKASYTTVPSSSNIVYFVTNITSLDGSVQTSYFDIQPPSSGVIITTRPLIAQSMPATFLVEVYAVDLAATQPKTARTVVRVF